MSTYRQACRDELTRVSEDVLYAEKSHFAAQERLVRWERRAGVFATVAAAVSAATVFADIPVVTGVAALLASIASGILAFAKLAERAELHLAAGRQMGALRVEIRQALKIDLADASVITDADARSLVVKMSERKAGIDREAPGTTERDFKKAQKKVKAGHFDHDSVPDRGKA